MGNWSETEDELIIADYFLMLQKEIAGQDFNKSDHRKALAKLLNNRSESSIEFKHQNISAALINNGFPYIKGYKPRWNYQKLLEEKIVASIKQNNKIEINFNKLLSTSINYPLKEIQFDKWQVDPPKPAILKEPMVEYFKSVKTNYLEQEQKNKSIGETGEKLALEYEKWRLKQAGLYSLAKEVRWISKEEGDGAGFDILSKDFNGIDIFIEVKATTLGKETPIFFSKRENDFSELKKGSFFLYRIFDVKQKPKMFQRNGPFKNFCTMQPVNFKGFF